MQELTLYGPVWSAYTRTARLTLIEKQVEHNLVDVDFSSGAMPQEHLSRHPFEKVPTLRHLNFELYETSAICRYIDTAFDGPSLQPSAPRELARMAQIIAILDTYLSEEIRMGFVSERLFKPALGLELNLARQISARAAITKGFNALSDCVLQGRYLAGDQLSLADLHAAPLFDYLCLTPGGDELIANHPRLQEWWSNLKLRSSIIDTHPDLSMFNITAVRP